MMILPSLGKLGCRVVQPAPLREVVSVRYPPLWFCRMRMPPPCRHGKPPRTIDQDHPVNLIMHAARLEAHWGVLIAKDTPSRALNVIVDYVANGLPARVLAQ